MNKIIKIALIVVGLVGAVLWYNLPSSEMAEGDPAGAAQSGAMSAMFMITYLLLGIAVVVALAFTLANLFSTPASLKKTLMVIAGFAVVVIIAYVLADDSDVSSEFLAKFDETPSTVRKIGTGIWTFLILTVIAVVLMVVPSVKKLIGK